VYMTRGTGSVMAMAHLHKLEINWHEQYQQ
jgi:hypothetical protein